MSIVFSEQNLILRKTLQSFTGENAMLCVQCKKCTLGCPSAYAMRMKPHELMRAIQLGLTEKIYWSGGLWICLSCDTCNTRCPQGINIHRLIQGLREMEKKHEYYNPHPAVPAMFRLFLKLVKGFGRTYPLGLALFTHLRLLAPFKDIDLASPMLMRGKWKPPSLRRQGTNELRRAMAIVREIEKDQEPMALPTAHG